jgi:ketosteroid isomerase-like protein
MSDDNVALVREVLEEMRLAREQGELTPRIAELFAADVTVDMSRRVFNPHVYEGHGGLRRLVREVREVWDEFQIIPERFIAVGDRVVVIATRRGRGRGSGLEVADRAGVVWTLRDGQVIRFETDLDPDEALALAGAD